MLTNADKCQDFEDDTDRKDVNDSNLFKDSKFYIHTRSCYIYIYIYIYNTYKINRILDMLEIPKLQHIIKVLKVLIHIKILTVVTVLMCGR